MKKKKNLANGIFWRKSGNLNNNERRRRRREKAQHQHPFPLAVVIIILWTNPFPKNLDCILVYNYSITMHFSVPSYLVVVVVAFSLLVSFEVVHGFSTTTPTSLLSNRSVASNTAVAAAASKKSEEAALAKKKELQSVDFGELFQATVRRKKIPPNNLTLNHARIIWLAPRLSLVLHPSIYRYGLVLVL